MRGSVIIKGTARDQDSHMIGVDQVTIIRTTMLTEITIEEILITLHVSLITKALDKITVMTTITIQTGKYKQP